MLPSDYRHDVTVVEHSMRQHAVKKPSIPKSWSTTKFIPNARRKNGLLSDDGTCWVTRVWLRCLVILTIVPSPHSSFHSSPFAPWKREAGLCFECYAQLLQKHGETNINQVSKIKTEKASCYLTKNSKKANHFSTNKTISLYKITNQPLTGSRNLIEDFGCI